MTPVGARDKDSSIGDLVGELTREAAELARHEVRLAQAELKAQARLAAPHVALVAAGALVAYAGLIAVVFSIAWALTRWLPLWAAALLTGVVVIAAGTAACCYGLMSIRGEQLVPRQTIDSIKENVKWTRHRIA